jgi:NAD(P)-dependent dehydrogenase (short-subunit alcohol dehydrogenase family)
MEFGLQGKVILITGAASGIGRATALAFAQAGSLLGLLDINGKGLKICAEEARGAGNKVIDVATDLSTADGVKDGIREAVEYLGGRVDVLVNNVGICEARTFDESTDDDWQALFNINFMSNVRACRSVLPIMRTQPRGGVILNNTSDLARQPEDAMLDYASLKAALLVLTKGLARAEGPKIRVNAIAPGPIWTPLWTKPGGLAEGFSEIHNLPPKEAVEHELALRKLPLRRLGKPEEVANVILFLASDLASFVTSSIWGVDGGSIRNIV